MFAVIDSFCGHAWPVCVTDTCLFWIAQKMHHVKHVSCYFAGQLLESMDIVASTSMLIERELVEETKRNSSTPPPTLGHWQRR